MKKLLLTIVGLLVATGVKAAEYQGNPDRMPSIGISYSGLAETGDFTVSAGSISAKQDLTVANGMLALDGRIPVSDAVTLDAAIGLTASQSTADETSLLNGGKSKTSGFSFRVGARFYIH